MARTALEAGTSFLAVASVDEGAELREAGITAPILLLSIPLPEELEEMELVTQIVFIKPVKKGETVSYGRIWTADRTARCAAGIP